MDNVVGRKSGLTWAVHISVALLVILWLFPTVGLLVSSFRTADQISASGWWASLFPAEQTLQVRTGGADVARQEGGVWIVEGNLFADDPAAPKGDVSSVASASRPETSRPSARARPPSSATRP